MHRVVVLGDSELLAKIGHRMQAMTLILLYLTGNTICRSISVNSEVPTQVRYDQNRGSGECRTKGLKGLLLVGGVGPHSHGTHEPSRSVSGDVMQA